MTTGHATGQRSATDDWAGLADTFDELRTVHLASARERWAAGDHTGARRLRGQAGTLGQTARALRERA